jgi:probable F420-dependent oxidoreductase
MRVGAVFPQTEIGGDVGAVRAYAQAVDRLGFRHLLAYDHVVGADPEVHAPWNWPYDIRTTFHEPLVLFGYLAACTDLELVTGILILPQRQTTLVAKQAAEVDLLTGGRFRLGVGIGWNQVEYQALGQDFGTRGRRVEQQIELLRAYWTQPSVTFHGDDDVVLGAGLSPLPVQRPIPIWIGGSSNAVYRRIGRLADGWFPQVGPGPRLDEARAVIEQAAREHGRDPGQIGLESQVSWSGSADQVADQAARWAKAGATHLAVNTMNAGLGSVDDHISALTRSAEALGLTRPA